MTDTDAHQTKEQNDAQQNDHDTEEDFEGLLEAVAEAVHATERDAEESQTARENALGLRKTPIF
jgi:hypothetical protein